MRSLLQTGAVLAALAFPLCLPSAVNAASAIQKECSVKYQAAKGGNTLNGMTYNQFYKQCAADAKAAKAGGAAPATPTSTTSAPTTTAPTTTAPTTTASPTTTAPTSAPRTTAPVAAGNAVFPTALSAQFSKESAGKARMHTCLAQYNANKANNGTGNGGLRWIEKGGGYYSECNKRLKG